MIGALITTVQGTFATIFAEGDDTRRDSNQFDLMPSDDDAFELLATSQCLRSMCLATHLLAWLI